MAVAFDAATESAEFTTADPFTFDHTPVGTPRGVIVFIVEDGSGTDVVDGAVTYGGSALTRIEEAFDTVGEPGGAYAYFLGSSVPTGTQTVSISHTASATIKWAVAVTLTASADLEVNTFTKVEGDGANQQVTLDSGATTTQRYMAYFSAIGDVGSVTPIANTTLVLNEDFGANIGACYRETDTSSGSTTIGTTGISNDRAIVGIAIAEAAAAGFVPADPYGTSGFFGV